MTRPLTLFRERLFSAVLSDCLDAAGHRCQAMHARVRPLDELLVLCGRARTALYMDVYDSPIGENPYELEIRLVDDLKPDEVPVFACGTSGRIAPWGELLSTAARARQAAGCVTDGLVRDVIRIRAMALPVFHGGIGPLDTRGRAEMVAMDTPVTLAGVSISPGDWILGDADGVAVIPADRADAVFRAALEKIAAEDTTRAELEAGAPLRAVFARHGVL